MPSNIMHVTILGGGGQLASELARASWPAPITLRILTEAELDITDADAVSRAVERTHLVINAAAYTAVDKAESERELAFRVNRDGPAHLARACAPGGTPLIHVSTDYVFDGSKYGPYLEDDAIGPLGVYGESKAAGEVAVRLGCEKHLIFRTSWVVSAFGHNFVKTILRLAQERQVLRVVADQFGRPTPAKDLAAVVVEVVRRYAQDSPIPWGTYHYAASGRTTWYDLACRVVALQAAHTGRSPVVEAIPTTVYPTPAQRPRNSELGTRKLEQALGIVPPHWEPGIADIVSELLAGGR